MHQPLDIPDPQEFKNAETCPYCSQVWLVPYPVSLEGHKYSFCPHCVPRPHNTLSEEELGVLLLPVGTKVYDSYGEVWQKVTERVWHPESGVLLLPETISTDIFHDGPLN